MKQITENIKDCDEFTIFEALDRVSTLTKMQDALLGSVHETRFGLRFEEVHPAILKHHKILKVIQENLSELYQLLGQDLDNILTEKGQ